MVTRSWWLDKKPANTSVGDALLVGYFVEDNEDGTILVEVGEEGNFVNVPTGGGVFTPGDMVQVQTGTDGSPLNVLGAQTLPRWAGIPSVYVGANGQAMKQATESARDALATVEALTPRVDQALAVVDSIPEIREAADGAVAAASSAQEKADSTLHVGSTQPDATAFRMWIQTDQGTGKPVAVWASTGTEWAPHASFSGLIVVPGADGPTVVDGEGVNTSRVVAQIVAAETIAGQLLTGEALQVATLPRNRLDEETQTSLDAADQWDERVTITPQAVTISRSKVGADGAAADALVLQATRLDFLLEAQPVVSVDATQQAIHTSNLSATETARIGDHLLIPDSNGNLNFTFVGGML